MVLIILIVVSLVLITIAAVVATFMLTGEDKKQEANTILNEQNVNEMGESSGSIDEGNIIDSEEQIDPIQEAKKDNMLQKTENTELKIGKDTIWIPAGFRLHEDSAENVDGGIVITDASIDAKGNEFVWVPVSEKSFSNMFDTAEPAVALSGNTNVTSNYYSKLRSKSGAGWNSATVVNGAYSSTVRIREPELLIDYDEDDEKKYYEQAGYKSAEEMAKAFVNDYTNMRASIEKYKGFYIGRYELTGTLTSPTVSSGRVLTAKTAGNWYYLHKACRRVAKNNSNVTTTMIWGCQWDETMNWLKNTKFKNNPDAVDVNSVSWGNYSDYNTANGYKEGDLEYISVAGIKQNTGYSEYWSANKIYDLAGNYFDYTQEAYDTNFRVVRGGSSIYLSSTGPAAGRAAIKPDSDNVDRTARVVLYINK